MIGHLIQPELKALIEERNFTELRATLEEFSAPDIAEILGDLSDEGKAILIRILPHAVATEVFENLSLNDQERLVHALGNEEVAKILNSLSPDDRTALLEELPAAATLKLLNLLSPEERRIADKLLGYPEHSIGRRMTPDFVSIQQSWTVANVLDHLRQFGRDRETLNQLYVVDEKGRLVDWLRLRNVVVSDPSTPVLELLEGRDTALKAADDQEMAIAAFKKYDLTVLPVVDSSGVLVGVVTVDDVLDVAEEEATEDIQKLGGMEALDAPYLKVGLFSMLKKRAGWLSILFVSEMFTSTAMQGFQSEIEKAAVLATFLPLILSSGGNSGSQASTLIIRAMAVGDVHLRDWWHVFRRELMAGAALGCALAVLGFARIVLWQHLGFKSYGEHYLLLAATIGASLIGVILWGSLVGAMLPLLLRRLKLDPAVCSAPFVATLVDVTGIIIYFHTAFRVLQGTLL